MARSLSPLLVSIGLTLIPQITLISLISSITAGCADHRELLSPEYEERTPSDNLLDNLVGLRERQHIELAPDVVCAQCHPRQAHEYATATMRYGFASPTFNALELSLNQLSDGRFTHHASRSLRGAGAEGGEGAEGEEISQGAFCSDCHGPAATARGLEVSGDAPSASLMSEVGAREGGIGCDVCHTAREPREPSEGLKVTPSLDKLTAHHDPAPNTFHGYINASPSIARLSESEFCAPCHDVRPQRPDRVSDEHRLRSEDLFSEWARSPWAAPEHPLNPLRGRTGITGVHDDPSLIARGERVTCQDCHMSLYPRRGFDDEVRYDEHFTGVAPSELNRKAHKLYPASRVAVEGHLDPSDRERRRRVSTHYFSGASHPLTPFSSSSIFDVDALEPDALAPDTLTAPLISDEHNTLDVSRETWLERWRAWRTSEERRRGEYGEPRAAHQRRAELLRAALTLGLDEVPSVARRGASLRLDLWVENVGAGHNVPAGFSQEREVWVALKLTDQGRQCTDDADCSDLLEPPRFLDSPNRDCVTHTRSGERDPALPESGGWEAAARAERSAVCGAEQRCVLYRSGYLIDLDGDGLTHDEDLRHVLIERDEERLEETCVLSGPDGDARVRGVERGLVLFTNELQRVELGEDGEPRERLSALTLKPEGAPYDPLMDPLATASLSDPKLRRSTYATERARYERWRYRAAPLITPEGARRGLGLTAPTLLDANRAFNGSALRPFEPRLARYDVEIPESARGPLRVDARVRFRFFSPRLLRTLAHRHPDLVREAMIDEGLEIIDLARGERVITLE